MTEQKKEPLYVILDEKITYRLDVFCAQNRVFKNAVVENALTQYMDANGKKGKRK